MESKFKVKSANGFWYLKATEEVYNDVSKLSARMYQKIHSCLDYDHEQIALYLQDVRENRIEPSAQSWFGYGGDLMLIPAIWGFFYVFADEFQDTEIAEWGEWVEIPKHIADFLMSDEVQ